MVHAQNFNIRQVNLKGILSSSIALVQFQAFHKVPLTLMAKSQYFVIHVQKSLLILHLNEYTVLNL
jgi:hypothetical protein